MFSMHANSTNLCVWIPRVFIFRNIAALVIISPTCNTCRLNQHLWPSTGKNLKAVDNFDFMLRKFKHGHGPWIHQLGFALQCKKLLWWMAWIHSRKSGGCWWQQVQEYHRGGVGGMLRWQAGYYTTQSKKILKENDQLGHVHSWICTKDVGSWRPKGCSKCRSIILPTYPKWQVREKSEF